MDKKQIKERIDTVYDVGHWIFTKRQFRNNLYSLIDEPIKDLPPEMSSSSIRRAWSKYCNIDPKWAQYYYLKNGIASPEYIPSDVWFGKICRKLNGLKKFGYPMFQDKNYLDAIFDSIIKCPQVLVRNIDGQLLNSDFKRISFEEAVDICSYKTEVIVKPSIESKGARNISFISDQKDDKKEYRHDLEQILISKKKDYVVQEILTQHEKLAALNPDSINSVRVLSLLWDGDVHILGALVRIGTKGIRVDNPHFSDGLSCVLTKDGKMNRFAYDRRWNPHTELPNGIVLEKYEVPYFGNLIEKAKQLHYKVPHSHLVGWDLTVSEEGEPILIEANLDFPEIYFHQLGAGPIFEDSGLFDEIVRYSIK